MSIKATRITTISGIDVNIHWTFLILLLWIGITNWLQGQGLDEIMITLGFILVLFVCVLLHELGHSFAARRYGIKTLSITLLPIGGVASLEKMPEKPMQEIFVALAGPLVNVVIAGLLFVFLYLTDGLIIEPEYLKNIRADNFLFWVMTVNITLVVFNLLPAFPMDGGRVFRAALSLKLDRVLATDIAAGAGKILAVAFVIIGLFQNPFLVFIGLFIMLGAHSEARYVKTKSALEGLRVADGMMRNFTLLSPDDTLDKAVQALLDGQEDKFMIGRNGKLEGIITKNDLVQALKHKTGDTPLREFMTKDLVTITPEAPLQEAYELMTSKGYSALPVMDYDKITGLIDMENIAETMVVRQSVRKRTV
jgi:Zn-dependent protease